MTSDRKPTTNDAGIPVSSDEFSLTVGPDGPILLQDHYLIEQMANFNRERIPERQPHAKGGGAFGRFEVTKDVSQYTKAAVFHRFDALPPETVMRGLVIGASLMAGSRLAKGFVLRLDAGQFRLLMDLLLAGAGLVLLWGAFAL